MRRIVKKTVLYQCKKCGTTYQNARNAKACEAGSVEEKKFKKGDYVRTKRPHNPQHQIGDVPCLHEYQSGTVLKTSLHPFDAEYMIKGRATCWPDRYPGHVWEYIIRFEHQFCPGCGAHVDAIFFSPDLKRANRRS